MKLSKLLFASLAMLSFALFTGCSDESTEEIITQTPEETVTYSASFVLYNLSDAYFDFGDVTMTYLDANGETKVMVLSKSSVPSQLTVSNLSEGDKYSFVLGVTPKDPMPEMTEASYTFSKSTYIVRESSTGSKVSSTNFASTETVSADKVSSKLDGSIASYAGTIAPIIME